MSDGCLEMQIIDRNIESVGISDLRKLDRKTLKAFDDNKMLVIRDRNTPLAVVLSYEKYLIIQDQMKAMMETFEILSNQDELNALAEGMKQARDGQTRSIAEIRQEIQKGK